MFFCVRSYLSPHTHPFRCAVGGCYSSSCCFFSFMYRQTLRIPPIKNSIPPTIKIRFWLTVAEMKASMEAMKESMAQNNQDGPELFFHGICLLSVSSYLMFPLQCSRAGHCAHAAPSGTICCAMRICTAGRREMAACRGRGARESFVFNVSASMQPRRVLRRI